MKGYISGAHRLCHPAETLRRISPHLPAMGITRIADITGLDRIGIPVCKAVQPNSRSVSVSLGKGTTLELAKVSAAMESIEGYHADHVDLPVVRTSLSELNNQNQLATDPARLLLSDPTIYHPNLDLLWVKGTELLSMQEIWVPLDAVRTDFTRLPEGGFFQNSNGLASGNHLMEAISHAICEVVERDAHAFYELGLNPSAMLVDLDTVDSEITQSLFSILRRAGLEIFIRNLTHEIGIPTFMCQLFDSCPPRKSSQLWSSSGHGAHLSKEVALLRAITEAVQTRPAMIDSSRDNLIKTDILLNQFRSYQIITNQKPALLQGQVEEDYAEIPSLETESFDQDVRLQLDLIQMHGLDQVLMVDLTKPEFDIPVVHVLIPGMEFHKPQVKRGLGERAAKAKANQIMQQLEELMQ